MNCCDCTPHYRVQPLTIPASPPQTQVMDDKTPDTTSPQISELNYQSAQQPLPTWAPIPAWMSKD